MVEMTHEERDAFRQLATLYLRRYELYCEKIGVPKTSVACMRHVQKLMGATTAHGGTPTDMQAWVFDVAMCLSRSHRGRGKADQAICERIAIARLVHGMKWGEIARAANVPEAECREIVDFLTVRFVAQLDRKNVPLDYRERTEIVNPEDRGRCALEEDGFPCALAS